MRGHRTLPTVGSPASAGSSGHTEGWNGALKLESQLSPLSLQLLLSKLFAQLGGNCETVTSASSSVGVNELGEFLVCTMRSFSCPTSLSFREEFLGINGSHVFVGSLNSSSHT